MSIAEWVARPPEIVLTVMHRTWQEWNSRASSAFLPSILDFMDFPESLASLETVIRAKATH